MYFVLDNYGHLLKKKRNTVNKHAKNRVKQLGKYKKFLNTVNINDKEKILTLQENTNKRVGKNTKRTRQMKPNQQVIEARRLKY